MYLRNSAWHAVPLHVCTVRVRALACVNYSSGLVPQLWTHMHHSSKFVVICKHCGSKSVQWGQACCSNACMHNVGVKGICVWLSQPRPHASALVQAYIWAACLLLGKRIWSQFCLYNGKRNACLLHALPLLSLLALTASISHSWGLRAEFYTRMHPQAQWVQAASTSSHIFMPVCLVMKSCSDWQCLLSRNLHYITCTSIHC